MIKKFYLNYLGYTLFYENHIVKKKWLGFSKNLLYLAYWFFFCKKPELVLLYGLCFLEARSTFIIKFFAILVELYPLKRQRENDGEYLTEFRGDFPRLLALSKGEKSQFNNLCAKFYEHQEVPNY